MQPRSTSITDYTNEQIIVPLELDGIKTYATINTEFSYEEEGLKPTDTYLVYLLHPKYGSYHFNIELNEYKQLYPVGAPVSIEPEIVKTIVENIPS